MTVFKLIHGIPSFTDSTKTILCLCTSQTTAAVGNKYFEKRIYDLKNNVTIL